MAQQHHKNVLQGSSAPKRIDGATLPPVVHSVAQTQPQSHVSYQCSKSPKSKVSSNAPSIFPLNNGMPTSRTPRLSNTSTNRGRGRKLKKMESGTRLLEYHESESDSPPVFISAPRLSRKHEAKHDKVSIPWWENARDQQTMFSKAPPAPQKAQKPSNKKKKYANKSSEQEEAPRPSKKPTKTKPTDRTIRFQYSDDDYNTPKAAGSRRRKKARKTSQNKATERENATGVEAGNEILAHTGKENLLSQQCQIEKDLTEIPSAEREFAHLEQGPGPIMFSNWDIKQLITGEPDNVEVFNAMLASGPPRNSTRDKVPLPEIAFGRSASKDDNSIEDEELTIDGFGENPFQASSTKREYDMTVEEEDCDTTRNPKKICRTQRPSVAPSITDSPQNCFFSSSAICFETKGFVQDCFPQVWSMPEDDASSTNTNTNTNTYFNTNFVFYMDGVSYLHPGLPPGWSLGVDTSGPKPTPYYYHPHEGVTYFCPVVLPITSRSKSFPSVRRKSGQNRLSSDRHGNHGAQSIENETPIEPFPRKPPPTLRLSQSGDASETKVTEKQHSSASCSDLYRH